MARRFLVARDHSAPRPLDKPTFLDMWGVLSLTILRLYLVQQLGIVLLAEMVRNFDEIRSKNVADTL